MPKGVKRIRDQSGRVRSKDAMARNAAKVMANSDVKRIEALQAAKDQAKQAADGPDARASPLRNAEKLKKTRRPRKYDASMTVASGAPPTLRPPSSTPPTIPSHHTTRQFLDTTPCLFLDTTLLRVCRPRSGAARLETGAPRTTEAGGIRCAAHTSPTSFHTTVPAPPPFPLTHAEMLLTQS